MLKPKLNQRGSLAIIELGILLAVIISLGLVLNRIHVAKPNQTSSKNTSTQHKSVTEPTQTTTTPEDLTATPLQGSGIKGQILSGSHTDCYSNDPNSYCNKPRTATGTVIIKGVGDVTRIVKSNSTGVFIISTTPGTYTVGLQPQADGQPTGSSSSVVVEAGAYAQVTLTTF